MASSMEDRAAQYLREMSRFIADEFDEGVQPPTKSEPGKLARLSSMQFQELGTDVFDELIRRRSPAQGLPFLPVRDHYHPKRNQARQKLATLSRSKFVDLVRDVNDELKRRFPHKAEAAYAYDSMSHGSSYESLNVSPVYGGPPGPHHPQPGYGRQHSSEISPPTSSGGQPPYNGGYAPARRPSREGSYNSMDQAAAELNYSAHSQPPPPQQQQQQQGPPARVPSGEQRRPYSPGDEADKLRNEYEMRLAAMRKRVGQLESQLLDYRGDSANGNPTEQLENMERLNTVLTQKNERLDTDLRILREQLVSAKADVPALRQENDRLKQERTRFIERERDLKSKLDEARASIRKLKTTSVFAMDHGDADIMPSPAFVNSGGVIRPSSVRVFQEAIESVLSAVRSEGMENELPDAQHAVEAACDELKADVHGYHDAHSRDPASWPLSDEAKHRMPDTLQALDANLRKLAVAVDKHLGSMGVLPLSLLEAAASHLATSVVELVKLLKVCYEENKAAPRPQAHAGHQQASAGYEQGNGGYAPHHQRQPRQQRAASQESLEESTDSIIAGIQSMLQLVRAPVPDPNALFSTLRGVITSIRLTIGICRTEFDVVETGADLVVQISVEQYDPKLAQMVMGGLEKGDLQLTDQLNDISEAQEAAGDDDLDNEIVRELLSEMAFKQRLTSALIDVGKLTKTLVMWLE